MIVWKRLIRGSGKLREFHFAKFVSTLMYHAMCDTDLVIVEVAGIVSGVHVVVIDLVTRHDTDTFLSRAVATCRPCVVTRDVPPGTPTADLRLQLDHG